LKIALCGKGGSGKSTVVALLAEEFRRRGWSVLVVDSDESNSGLHRLLGFDRPPRPLLDLVGGKKNVRRGLKSGSSEGEGGPELSVLARPQLRLSDLPPEHVAARDRTRLVTVGKIHQALEGCACPMGLVSREFLKKIQTQEGEVVVVDFEAGLEHFGRGIETSLDAVIVVVEPSFESLEMAGKVRELTEGAGAKFLGAVVNKVESPGLASQVSKELEARGVSLLGVIHHHAEIAAAGLTGGPVPWESARQEAAGIVDAVLAGR